MTMEHPQIHTEAEVVAALRAGHRVVDTEGDDWVLGARHIGEARFRYVIDSATRSLLTEQGMVWILTRRANRRSTRFQADKYELCARPAGMPRLSFSSDFGPFTVVPSDTVFVHLVMSDQAIEEKP
jgi:hypothetical protein